MAKATLTSKGQVVIPVEIRKRYSLSAGMQIDFVDEGDQIVLRVLRPGTHSDPEAGFGMVKVDPRRKQTRSLSDFNAAEFTKQ